MVLNHTYNAQQIEWFKAGGALNVIREEFAKGKSDREVAEKVGEGHSASGATADQALAEGKAATMDAAAEGVGL